MMKKRISFLLVFTILLSVTTALADDSFNLNKDGYSTSYTYGYDYWGDVQESPDAYRVATVLDSVSLGLNKLEDQALRKPQSLYVRDKELYICDTGNNRIVQIHCDHGQYEVVRIISSVTAATEDYELAEGFYSKSRVYEQAIDERVDAEKKLADLSDSNQEADGTESAKAEKIEAASLELEQAQEKERLAHDEAVEAEEKAKMQGCKIWEYGAWQKNEEGQIVSLLNTPNDIAVDNEGNIYIADTNNYRVVKMDRDCNLIWEFTKPMDATFDQSIDFLPKKIVVDIAGRVYVLVTNVNKGIVKYDTDMTFTGFIGATPVSVSMVDYIWKKYFMTQAQRNASVSFVPTEYENIYIDKDGFIYATITNFSEYDLKSDAAKPIRRLNGLGNDILVKNDRYPPIGDLWWMEGDSTYFGPSKMTDVTVFDNDIYVVLDRVRGRLFGYDDQGIMLWAFGTRGNIKGAFTSAVSIEHIGTDLFVLDQLENSVTVFTPTEYGNKIYDAIRKYQKGEYDDSADIWREVLKENANYPMAFRGIGRTVFRQNDYESAMEYFKMAHDRENYGRVFKLYRKEWIEKNIGWIFGGMAVILLVPLMIGRIKRMKWEVIMHEHSKVRRNG